MDEVIENEMEEKDEGKERNTLNIATTPEFILTLCTAMLAILMAVMEAVQPRGIPLRNYKLDQEDFSFWVYAIFAVLLVFTAFFAILVYRVFKRRRNGIDSKVHLYVHYKQLDLYWFFLLVLYGFLSIISICLFWFSDDHRYLIVGLLIPISVALLLNFYLSFALNDFKYVEDIQAVNKTIQKHNDRIDEIKEKINEFKKELGNKSGAGGKSLSSLTHDEIQELSKHKIQYKRKDKPAGKRLESIQEDEEMKESPKKDHSAADQVPEEEEEKINPEDWDDEEIEEGGEESKQGRSESQDNKPLFEKAKTFNNGNLFGKAASMIIRDDEIDHDSPHSEFIKASKKFKLIKDWRANQSVIGAFFTGNLRPNDYHMYLSVILAYLIIAVMGGLICWDQESVEGVSWFMAFFYIFTAIGSLTRPFECD